MKKKVKKYLFFFFGNNFKYKIYKKKIYKIINFSKKNYNFITYDFFFFIFNNIDLNDLNKIVRLIKSLKINLSCNLPYNYLINLYESKNYDNTFLSKKNISKKYRKINFHINNISKLILSNNFLINDIFNCNKKIFKKFRFKIKKIKSNISIKNFSSFNYRFKKRFNKKNISKSSKVLKLRKYLYSNKFLNNDKIFFLLKFLIKNISRNKSKKNFYIYKSLIFFLKKKKIKFKINLNMMDDMYIIVLKRFDTINKLRMEIYDNISNILNISYLKFNFFFLKNGSDLRWILNLIEINSIDPKYLELKKFLELKRLDIKKIENKYFISIRKLFKIFNVIEINKLKLDLLKNSIINSNTNVIKKLTRKHYKKDYYNDIIQESHYSLIKSVDNYNKRFGISLNTFVVKNIKKKINNYIYRNCRLIYLPHHITSLMRKINKVIKDYNDIYNQNPNIDYIKDKLELSKERIKRVLSYYKEPLSISKTIYNDDNEDELLDSLKDFNNFDFDEEIFNNDLRDYVESLISQFNNRSANIISMRYGINFSRRYTLEEVGSIYGLSKERIRQIQNENINSLKFLDDNEKLKNYFNYKYKYYKF